MSYPRSGNTFMRALVANYFSGQDHPLSLAQLSATTLGEHFEDLWRDLTGRPAVDRTLEMQWSARVAYFERLRGIGGGSHLLVKSHTANGGLFGIPAFNFEPQDRVIHVVRHPCDVALSCADFYGISVEESVRRLLSPDFLIDGRPQHGFEVLGSWAQHTTSWSKDLPVPVFRVRYKDLVGQPAGVLRELVPFLGGALDEARIATAVTFSEFGRLHQQEAAAGFAEAPAHATSGRFFRQGKPGQWLDVLADELSMPLIEAHAELLSGLGFEPDPRKSPLARKTESERHVSAAAQA